MCLWCSAETSSHNLFFPPCFKVLPSLVYLLFTSQLTPTALKHFSSSSSHCYGEQDCSSPTPRIFVLELTSVGMANITCRPQEQVVLNCALYSYTVTLLKYSNFYCVPHLLVTVPVHICKIWNSELSSHLATPCVICYELHYSNSCFVDWFTWQSLTNPLTDLCLCLIFLFRAPELAFRYNFLTCIHTE